MCLELWDTIHSRHRARIRTRRAASDASRDASTTITSTSGWFTTKDSSSISSTTTSSSIASGLAKNIARHGPFFYKLPEIAAATLNFSASQQIGASSWKGMLHDSCVAVVRKPGVARNFRRLLRNVCALHHINLAQVMGGCCTADGVLVVYEFVDGIDLQACLHNKLAPGYTVLSTWKMRIQVALDVAKGLEYVHEHAIACSAHKNLTSSSVLLTKDTLRAKLALVGMAALTGEVVVTETIPHKEPSSPDKDIDECKLQEGDVSSRKRTSNVSSTVKIKGMRGYMPPEYVSSGEISQKYDVFTYGTVLLELLKGQVGVQVGGGQKNKFHGVSIVDEVRSLMENGEGMTGRLRLWMDSRLKDSYPVEDAVRVVLLALACVRDNPQRRPPMSEVALQMGIFLDSAASWESQRSVATESGTLQGR